MVWWKIRLRQLRTMRATARYKHRVFRKGKIYTIRRKYTPARLRLIRRTPGKGYRILSVMKFRKRR